MAAPVVAREAIVAALAWRRQGQSARAEAALRALLAQAPRHPELLHGLSLCAEDRGDRAEAMRLAQAAIDAAPHHPGLHYTLGVMCDSAGQPEAAAAAYRAALARKPDFVAALNNLGLAALALGQLTEAADAFGRLLALQPDHAGAQLHRGIALLRRGDARAALPLFEQARQHEALAVDACTHGARACLALERVDEALAWYDEACRRAPDDLGLAIERATALPSIYRSREDLVRHRARYAQGLEALAGVVAHWVSSPAADAGPPDGIEHVNFLLAYQGEDDRALQARYGELVSAVMARCVPLKPPLAVAAAPRSRLRVGFASCFWRDCTVGHYFRAWLTDLDPARFDVRVYALGGPEDAFTQALRTALAHFRRLELPLAQCAQQLYDEALDVLIYPELGMAGRSFALAALRLAPVQAMAWGHPMTSGLPTLDVFLSCRDMEPPAAEQGYTERLVGLPGLGTRYVPPPVGHTHTRASLGLPAQGRLYLFPNSVFKVHPDNDALVARVLAADPSGWLVVCAGTHPAMTDAFVARLRGALSAQGVAADRLWVMPALARADYLELNRLCDLMLDTLHWSGGNTSLDALAAGLPIVAHRGRYMRGRQTAAMLDALGLGAWVASTPDDWVARSLVLAQDEALRASVRQQIEARRADLFDDPRPIAALSDWLDQIAASTRREGLR